MHRLSWRCRHWVKEWDAVESFRKTFFSAKLTMLDFGKKRATRPGSSCPSQPRRTRGDTAQPSPSLRGRSYTYWKLWKQTDPEPEDWRSSSCRGASPLVLLVRSEPKSQKSAPESVNQKNICFLVEYYKWDIINALNSLLVAQTLTMGGRELSGNFILSCAEPRLVVKCLRLSHRLSVLCLSDGDHFWKILSSRSVAEACQASDISTPFILLKPINWRPLCQRPCMSLLMKPS